MYYNEILYKNSNSYIVFKKKRGLRKMKAPHKHTTAYCIKLILFIYYYSWRHFERVHVYSYRYMSW